MDELKKTVTDLCIELAAVSIDFEDTNIDAELLVEYMKEYIMLFAYPAYFGYRL